MRFLPIATLTGGALVAGLFAAGDVHAAGSAFCNPQPVGSRLEVECVNNDPGPATTDVLGLCTNLVLIAPRDQRMDPHSTTHITFECGPGANPVLWRADAKTDLQQLLDNQRELQRDRDRDRY